MKKEKQNRITIVQVLIIVAFIIGAGVIALFPFDNRNLELKFVTDVGEYTEKESNVEIAEGKCKELFFQDINSVTIKEVIVYGNFKTIYLKKIGHVDFTALIESADRGEMRWVDDGLYVTGDNGIHLIMNNDYQEMLSEQSASFFQERLLLLGLYIVFIALLLLLCSVVVEIRNGDNRDNHGPIYEAKKFFSDIYKYKQYMIFAAKADLRAEVADSYLNRLWWLLEPFFNMIVYVVVFGNVMGSSIEHYSTFTFSSLLMWNFFNKIINYSVKLVRNNKDILSKVYIPKFVLLISNMILNMYKLLFSLIVLVIMMIVFQVRIGPNILWVLPAYLVMILLAFGLGMIFLHFGVYIDDLSYAVSILMTMLMFMSGIFYETMTTLPEPLNVLMMYLNPAAMFIDTMRNALLYNQAANLPILGVWLLLSVVLCCVGIHIVYKNENSYVKVV